MTTSNTIYKCKQTIRKCHSGTANLLQTLLFLLSSSLFASASLAQAHDHSAMPIAADAAAVEEHAQHAPAGDPRVGHVMDTDAHAEHEASAAADPHASHVMDADAHAEHGAPAAPDPHAGHVMDTNAETDQAMATNPHAQHAQPPAHDHSTMAADMDMSDSSSDRASLRDPHAYSNGFKVGEGAFAIVNSRLHLMDEARFGGFRMNRMEQLFLDGDDAAEYDAQGWYGTSYDRLVLKAEGELQGSSLEESNTELLWSHAIYSFWNTQIGVLNQTGDGPNRNWLALGIQGTAPYWFEVDATVYLGESGRSAFNLEAEYDLRLTQRLILQPRVEMNFYGQDDQATGIGSGLSDLSTGVRFQYQVNRQFVPYAGVEQVREYGQTARFSGSASGDPETRWLAGLRFWF